MTKRKDAFDGGDAFDVDAVRASLAEACSQAGGQKQWATTASVSPQYVSDVLKNRREPGESICRALGYKRKVTYARVDAWGKK